jgi:hypothetical protein
MRALEDFIDGLYVGTERLDRVEIYRRAVAAELSATELEVLDRVPEGEYAQDELIEAVRLLEDGPSPVERSTP